MRTLRTFCAMAGLLLAVAAFAVIETYEFSDPQLERRYQVLSAELRCPKCQNQNIADSNAPIAQDLRKLLYEQLEAGATDEEILDYMVARYGEFVRYRPDFGGPTLILWLAPLALLVGGLLLVVLTLRGRRGRGQASQLSAEEQRELEQILADAERRP
jgi:cytochrome c-type biogenesis protein CcmH